MKLGFLYAGQGSQAVGMGRDLYLHHNTFRRVFDQAPVDFDLKRLCFDGPEDVLTLTRYTQPCLMAFAVGVTALLADAGIQPEMAAGLSLGEYGALHAAGVLDGDTAIRLTAFRGKAMEQAAEGIDCAMTAVLGLERQPLLNACSQAASHGVVEIANYNYPGQLVISGETAAVKEAEQLALAAGAKRCIPLKVSGPFHTSLMAPASQVLAQELAHVPFGEMAFPVVFNATGQPLGEGQTVAQLLERQVMSSVRFEDCIRYMVSQGVDTMIEVGPGKSLAGFVRKTVSGVKVYSIETSSDLQAAITALKGAQICA